VAWDDALATPEAPLMGVAASQVSSRRRQESL